MYVEDADGKIYDIEIQKDNRGSIPERARYNSSNLDTHSLLEGEDYKNLATTYVIFITLKDVLGGGFPIYNIERTIRQLNHAPFNDRSNIIYVNGSYKANDDIGRLMQDFQNPTPNTMHNKTLAKNLRELKGGKSTMLGPAIEELERRRRLEGEAIGEARGRTEGMFQKAMDMAYKLKARRTMSDEEIAELTSLTVEQVKGIPA